ncbi:MAG: carbon-nitrogen hydrolase family protein [Acidobacteria bacterium]|nr:carbon-nitrogen hydrolase family protein [Acidobacteriota bacterium]
MKLAWLLYAAAAFSQGWESGAPRDEIRPRFSQEASGALVIATDARAGLDGYWKKSFPVTGGRWYRFRTARKLENVPLPRRSAAVELVWLDRDGKVAPTDDVQSTQPEFPADGGTEVAGVYRAPSRAVRADVYLHLRWATNARALWNPATLTETARPAGRKARLAAVHFKPQGGRSADNNRRMFAPLIEDAARQRADLVCLGECLTTINNGVPYIQAAEPIPGPSTAYFGELARRHNLYIVAGLVERDGHLVYNTAALLGPDGRLAGKYRKVSLPPGEVQSGIAPGDDYPVFETRFGKLGMMICYDLFFPEVSRQLAARGAEVIAVPIYGGNVALARARAIDDHVYLVTSTYMKPADEWMRTGIWDHQGRLIASAGAEGTVAVAEVDLDRPAQWRWLGDFRPQIPRSRPVWRPDIR